MGMPPLGLLGTTRVET
ncbi:hypothetical protein LINPERHAP1_LOCUS24408 [Linum perenne]